MSEDVGYIASPWQQEFHALPTREALGGGAAGPGKTRALIMDPMQQIMVEHQRCDDPGHPHHQAWGMSKGWALHLRRTMPMLDQSIKWAKQIFTRTFPDVTWNENKTTFIFPSGYRYEFGHCKDLDSVETYIGGEYTHIGYDELIQFDQSQYDTINSRLRVDDPVLQHMLKIRAVTNPVLTRANMESVTIRNPYWVRDRFVKPAPEGRVVHYRKIIMSDGTEEEIDFMFLPALLKDNPSPAFRRQYEIQLRSLPKFQQHALLNGDWWVTADSYFGEVWNRHLHIVAPFKIPDTWKRFRSMDWGFKVPGCVHWYAMDDDGNLYVEKEYTFKGKTDVEVAKGIKAIEQDLGLWSGKRSQITGPADTQLWEKRGNSGKSMAEVMMQMGVPWVPADKLSRTRNAQRLAKRLADTGDGTKQPGIVFFGGRSGCPMAIETIPAMQCDPGDSETPLDGGNDHWADSVFYGTAYASRGRAGIPSRRNQKDDEDDDLPPLPDDRGRLGYGW